MLINQSCKNVLLASSFIFSIQFLPAQISTKSEELRQFSTNKEQLYKLEQTILLRVAKEKGWPLQIKRKNGDVSLLTGIDGRGLPEYTGTTSNLNAAATLGTNQLWVGGELGLSLDGGSINMANKLAIWDAGRIRETHVELGANRVIISDGVTGISDHSTHVAGTMIGKGINSIAKGMSFNTRNLIAYDFSSDISEMSSAAAGLLISNHSYGSTAGWSQNSDQGNRWEFNGEAGANEDYKFGYYSSRARDWDSIAFLAPNYLIVKSAGNKRNDNGPAVGANYWRFNSSGVMVDSGPRPSGISSNNSYDILPTYATTKNILTVGAVEAIPDGYKNSSQVVMSSFTSWGPTDDGRIKPDVVANGVGLISSVGTADNAYANMSGTSMSAPNASGSLFLLQEHYNILTSGLFMRAATLKGLVIHTIDEAGSSPGPDYSHGWGLINVRKAAEVITARNTNSRILENNLTQGSTFTLNAIASGTGPLVATISWTDPPGTVETINYLNNRTPKLVNDLDIEITRGAAIFQPWKLSPLDPSLPAFTGDNILDNVEKIEIKNPFPGETYVLKIKHKGTLKNNQQAYSLILSGVGGAAYCTSGPSSSANSRINNFSFGGINNTTVTGCTQYSNYTEQVAFGFPNQSIPLSLTLGTCGANADKMAKVFIDWNADGDFVDANELVATSGIINGTGVYNTNITIPQSVKTGFSSRIRVVCMETTNANNVLSCGTFAGGGETQDYTISYSKIPIDIKPESLLFPDSALCATDSLAIVIKLTNTGSDLVVNFPVSVLIKNGTTVIATLTDSVKQILISDENYYLSFKNTFNALPGINYQFTIITNLSTDLNKTNDTLIINRSFLSPSNATLSNLKGQLCTPIQASLSVTNSSGTVFWYDNPTSTTPIGIGATLNTNIIPTNRTYYAGINDAAGRIGPSSKSLFTSGGYRTLSSYMKIETFSPLLIESARMYFGNSGRVTVKVTNVTTGVQVASRVLDVLATNPNPQAGDLNENNPLDTGRIVPLNLQIPDAGNYTMSLSYDNGVTVFRNNSGPVPYPYSIPGLMSITGNDGNPNSAFYYYFYNIKVRSLGCAKPMPRQSVVAPNPLTPAITQNGTVLKSNVTAGAIQWYFNNVLISGAIDSNYTFTQTGIYTLTVTIGSCTFISSDFNASVTSIPLLNPVEINLIITNNPGNGFYHLMFNVKKKEKIQIEILNIMGQVIQREEFEKVSAGLVQREINISKNASGVYLMKLFFDKKQYVHKLILK